MQSRIRAVDPPRPVLPLFPIRPCRGPAGPLRVPPQQVYPPVHRLLPLTRRNTGTGSFPLLATGALRAVLSPYRLPDACDPETDFHGNRLCLFLPSRLPCSHLRRCLALGHFSGDASLDSPASFPKVSAFVDGADSPPHSLVRALPAITTPQGGTGETCLLPHAPHRGRGSAGAMPVSLARPFPASDRGGHFRDDPGKPLSARHYANSPSTLSPPCSGPS